MTITPTVTVSFGSAAYTVAEGGSVDGHGKSQRRP